MFVYDEARLGVGFTAALASLGNLARGGLLTEVCRQAYAEGIARLPQTPDTGMGPRAPHRRARLPELVHSRARELVACDGMANLALRWEAWDPAAGLFPALDADLRLTPDPPATVLKLAATYRPPPGYAAAGPDRAVVHQAASATIASFLSRIAEVCSASAAEDPWPGEFSR